MGGSRQNQGSAGVGIFPALHCQACASVTVVFLHFPFACSTSGCHPRAAFRCFDVAQPNQAVNEFFILPFLPLSAAFHLFLLYRLLSSRRRCYFPFAWRRTAVLASHASATVALACSLIFQLASDARSMPRPPLLTPHSVALQSPLKILPRGTPLAQAPVAVKEGTTTKMRRMDGWEAEICVDKSRSILS